MDQRTRRSPARFLAPLALIAVLVAFLAIVTSSGGGGSSDQSTATTTTKTSTTSTKTSASTTKKPAKQSGAKIYTIKVGDTLGGIASKTGVPLSKIEELNPSVDPHALTAGQQIRLR